MPDPIKTGNPNPAVTPAVNNGQVTPTPGAGAQAPQTPAVGDPKGGDPKMVPLTALHESREENKTIKQELDQLKTVLDNVQKTFNPTPQTFGQPQVPAYNPAPVYNPTVQTNARSLDDLWEENPRAAMQTELQMAISYYDSTQAAIDSQEEEAARKYPDYDQYRNKVRGYIRMVRPEQRANPGTVDTAYFLAKGQNADKLRQTTIEETIAKIRAGEQIQGFEGASSGTQVPADAVKPTNDQVNAANVMGMSIEDYLKNVKK